MSFRSIIFASVALLQLLFAQQVSALQLLRKAFINGAASKQPLRCTTSPCAPYQGDCKSDSDCISNLCYENKCGMGATCRKEGDACRLYASSTCCTDRCIPVMLRSDCKRVMGISDDKPWTGTIKLNCDLVGVCAGWGDENSFSSSALTTPWAVNAASDSAAKYHPFKDITFTDGTHVMPEKGISRRMGQTYKDIDAATQKPGWISDAGVVLFDADSWVDKTKWKSYIEGTTHWCIAPILKGGLGGGFYAIGQNCCFNEEFKCATGVEGLVVTSDQEKYKTAQDALEMWYGWEFHDDSKGVKTLTPTYVRMVENAQQARLMKPPGNGGVGISYVYVPLAKPRVCVAPITSALPEGKKPNEELSFWAVGRDAECLEGGMIQGCDDGGADGSGPVKSGVIDSDLSGEYRMAAHMASIRFGITIPADKPLFAHCSKDVLVALDGVDKVVAKNYGPEFL